MTNGVDKRKRDTLRRFAAIGATAPFVGTASAEGKDEELSDALEDNETRGGIRGYVRTTPGAHFSKIRDDLRLGTGEAQYHLRKLEESGLVESTKDGDYRRYYASGRFDPFQKRALGYLRRETSRGIILGLLRHPEATGARLAANLGVSRPTISNAASDLASAGLLDREDGYTLSHPEQLIVLVLRYAESFGPDAVTFADESPTYFRYDP